MCDTGRLYRDASVLALRKKQVDRLQREVEILEQVLKRRGWTDEAISVELQAGLRATQLAP